MSDGTYSLPMEDQDWRHFCEQATAEISQDIDAALLRTAKNSSLADAVLLAGYLNRGHLFAKHPTDLQITGTYLRADFMESQDE